MNDMKDWLGEYVEDFEEWFYSIPDHACFHCFTKEYRAEWKKWKYEHKNSDSLNTEKLHG